MLKTLQLAVLIAAIAGGLTRAWAGEVERQEWDGTKIEADCFSRDDTSRQSADETRQVTEWVAKLVDESHSVRRQASAALLKLGDASVAVLAGHLNDPDPEVRSRARAIYEVLAARGPAGLPALDLVFPADVGSGQFLLVLGAFVAKESLYRPAYRVQTPKPQLDHRGRAASPATAAGRPAPDPVLRPGRTPCLMIQDSASGYLPLWFGPRDVVLPPAIRSAPVTAAVQWEPYCLVSELDAEWQPTTAKARARVAAVTHYLRLGGSVLGSPLPRVPVPAWVKALEERAAGEDHEATASLLALGAAVPPARVERALALGQANAIRMLPEVDPVPYAQAIQRALTGELAHDAGLLGLLTRAGVPADGNRTVYPAAAFAAPNAPTYYVFRYLRRFGQPLSDDVLKALIYREGNDSIWSVQECGPLLSPAQQAWLAKLAADAAQTKRVRFTAHCLLFYAGADEHWWRMREMVTAADLFRLSYNTENEEELFGFLLTTALRRCGRPQRAIEETLAEHLTDYDAGILWTWPAASLAPAALAALRQNPSESLIRGLTRLRFQPAVDEIMRLMPTWNPGDDSLYGYGCCLLREFAAPRSGPFVAAQLERLRPLTGREVVFTRPLLVETLARLGQDYPAGRQVLARIADGEPPYSHLRALALAGLHRQGEATALPRLREELRTAPLSLKGRLLQIYAHTGAPEAGAVLREQLTHRYRPVRIAAGLALVGLGDGAGLPVVCAERFWINASEEVKETLWRYWQRDPPEAEVRLLETSFGLWLDCPPERARQRYSQTLSRKVLTRGVQAYKY